MAGNLFRLTQDETGGAGVKMWRWWLGLLSYFLLFWGGNASDVSPQGPGRAGWVLNNVVVLLGG